jgi:hypothetical protein
MNADIAKYNAKQAENAQSICTMLALEINSCIPNVESKIWHGGPAWFNNGNPLVGYWVRKSGAIQLLFWSGQSFDEPKLKPEGKFKAAAVSYTEVEHIDIVDLHRWLDKAMRIQWDYKNIVKRRGELVRLK